MPEAKAVRLRDQSPLKGLFGKRGAEEMPYWRLFYHIVWATRDREPLIQDGFAQLLHRRMASKATQLGAIVHAVGGTEDHVHLVMSVPPSIALSEFIRQVKGNSSHFVNHQLAIPATFAWQAEYGVVSLDGKQLDRVVQYVKEQKQHHSQRTTVPILERLAQERKSGETETTLKVRAQPL